MGRKNCKRTPAERAIHEEAVRLRRMTDKQLVEQFHRASDLGMDAGAPSLEQIGTETGNHSVQQLLTALSEGKCKGIKSGIAYKVAQFAAEEGLI